MSKKAKEPIVHIVGLEGDARAAWNEWNRLTAIGTNRRMVSPRSFTVVIEDCGVQLASRTDFLTRGKTPQICFHFTGKTRPDYAKGRTS